MKELPNKIIIGIHGPVCEERKGRKGKDSEEWMAMKAVALG